MPITVVVTGMPVFKAKLVSASEDPPVTHPPPT